MLVAAALVVAVVLEVDSVDVVAMVVVSVDVVDLAAAVATVVVEDMAVVAVAVLEEATAEVFTGVGMEVVLLPQLSLLLPTHSPTSPLPEVINPTSSMFATCLGQPATKT